LAEQANKKFTKWWNEEKKNEVKILHSSLMLCGMEQDEQPNFGLSVRRQIILMGSNKMEWEF